MITPALRYHSAEMSTADLAVQLQRAAEALARDPYDLRAREAYSELATPPNVLRLLDELRRTQIERDAFL